MMSGRHQCPGSVPNGGTNELFFCVGPRASTLRIFPIFNVFRSLPLKFMNFTSATGHASGILAFRNAIGINARAPGSVAFPGLDAVDFAATSIRDVGNVSDIVTKEGVVDGEVIALWQLLTEYPENDGEPVDGGKIKLYLGPPPS